MAHISSPDKEVGSPERAPERTPTFCRTARAHLGVSVEDRKYGLPRIADLQTTPARVRFLSIEPLLEDLGKINLSGISWAIVGGESGPGARPMLAEWVAPIRDQCRESRVPFFFKQWGGVRRAKNGRLLEGRTYDEYPQRVVVPVPEKSRCIVLAQQLLASLEPVVGNRSLVRVAP